MMKKLTYNLIPILFIAIAITGLFSSCNKEDNKPNNGNARILYVRVTNPSASDSLLTGAYQGNLIAIVGQNLENTKEIWFNDQKASLTSTYITSTSILISIPTTVPKSLNNKMKLVFGPGDTLEYPFQVIINKPAISSMTCEYVADGGTATINGDYFYEPLTVTFPGGGVAELVSVTDQILKVKVPAGSQPGQITIKTNFGLSKSNFWFRDNRNIFVGFDPLGGWSGSEFLVSNPGESDPPLINGNYSRVTKSIASWSWTPICDGQTSTNIPDEAILKPSLYNLKFELCTIKPYSTNGMWFVIGAKDADHGVYKWDPPLDTKGVWQTITIPFEEVTANYTTPMVVIPGGYYTRLVFCGNGTLDCDMAYDNFRIVPKVIKDNN